MNNVQDTFKHNQARKQIIVGGAVLMICITLLSCVSSFMIYREGFTDLPDFAGRLLALFAVIVVEGAFIWLVFGFTRAFASGLERLISLFGLGFLVMVMLTNIVTHFMMVKNLPLNEFQNAWLAWGAVSVFIGVLLIVLAITLADPVSRLTRLELRYQGKQQETILQAKTDGLNNEAIQQAIAKRANYEAQQLVGQILGKAGNRNDDADDEMRLTMQPATAHLRPGKRGRPPLGK